MKIRSGLVKIMRPGRCLFCCSLVSQLNAEADTLDKFYGSNLLIFIRSLLGIILQRKSVGTNESPLMTVGKFIKARRSLAFSQRAPS